MESVAAINKAAFEGNSEELCSLLSQYEQQHPSTAIDNLIDIDDSGRGPLHFAVLGKQVEVVRVLLERFNCSPFVLDGVKNNYNLHCFNYIFLGCMEPFTRGSFSWQHRNYGITH